MAPFVVIEEVAIGCEILEAFLALRYFDWCAFGLLQNRFVRLESLAFDLEVTLQVDDRFLSCLYLVFECLAAGKLVLVLLLSKFKLVL